MDDAQRSRSFLIFLASGCGSGFFPVAPGTAGTGVGFCVCWCLSHFSSFLFLITSIVFIVLSAWIADRTAKLLQQKDPSCIVIDEIAGYLVTMALIPWSWLHAAMGFLLFRLFDIVKPFPIRYVDRKVHGGWGIVLDDVLAGLYANIVLQGVLYWI